MQCFLFEFWDLQLRDLPEIHPDPPYEFQGWCAHMAQGAKVCFVRGNTGDQLVNGVLPNLAALGAKPTDIMVLNFAVWQNTCVFQLIFAVWQNMCVSRLNFAVWQNTCVFQLIFAVRQNTCVFRLIFAVRQNECVFRLFLPSGRTSAFSGSFSPSGRTSAFSGSMPLSCKSPPPLTLRICILRARRRRRDCQCRALPLLACSPPVNLLMWHLAECALQACSL